MVALALAAGALAFAAPWPAAFAALVVALALAVRRRPVLALVVAAAFTLGALRAERAVNAFESLRDPLLRDGAWPSRCAIDGEVVRSPARLGDAIRVDVDVRHGECEHLMIHGRVTLHVPDDVLLSRGDRVEAIAQLAPLHRFWNEGTGDPRPGQARRGALLSGGAEDVRVVARGWGPRALIDHARARIRERIVATYPPRTAAMARALVLGEDDLADGDQRAFRRSGLAHLLAVSGMHLVLVVAGLVAAMRAVLVRIPAVSARVDATRVAAAVGLPLTWIYEDLAGASGSAERAAWMTTVGLLAHAVARRPDAARALGLSILAMSALDPLAPFDLSFGLSAAATAGILAIAPRISAWTGDHLPAWLAFLARPVAATAAATIACAPLLAIMTGELPVAGLAANLVAVPLGEAAALPLCLVHALLAPVPPLERGVALAASGALDLVLRVARGFAAIPWGAVAVPAPTSLELAVLGLVAFALVAARSRRWAIAPAVALALLEIGARAAGAPHGTLRVTFLDVGQGDAALVDLPDGTALLLDGGGLVGTPLDIGERVIVPVLRARRRAALRAVILSHPHPDHYGGLVAAQAAVRVGALWDTGQGESEGVGGGYAALLAAARARGSSIASPIELCGLHEIGGASVEVLAPCPGPSPDRGPNDNSFVVRISYGHRSVLFAGDAEHEEEAELLARGARVRADVLKVGHHGSRTSSTRAWLAAVRPEVAVISCGIRNRFGHPARVTLGALAASGARIFRTDRDGAIVVTTDGDRLDVRAVGR